MTAPHHEHPATAEPQSHRVGRQLPCVTHSGILPDRDRG
jgi:hypothetical protein